MIRMAVYGADGALRCVVFVASGDRVRPYVDEELAPDEVFARVTWPDGRVLELGRPAVGEPWRVIAKRMPRVAEESAPAGA